MKEWIMPAAFGISLLAGLLLAGSGMEVPAIWVAFGIPTAAWLITERKRTTPALIVAVILIASVTAAVSIPLIRIMESGSVSNGWGNLKSFSSYQELEAYVENRFGSAFGGDMRYWGDVFLPVGAPELAESGTGSKSGFEVTIGGDQGFNVTIGGLDFSTTNIQVLGVDEADIVKCDGNYIYVVSGDNVFIIAAYPPEDAEILSNIEVESPVEMYVNGDKLAVIGWNYIRVYDISSRENPRLEREVSFEEGYYHNSRMIGDYVYLIVNSPIYRVYGYWEEVPDDWIRLPRITCNWNTRTVAPNEIYYFDDENMYPSEFVTIMAVNVKNRGEDVRTKTILMNSAQNIFVSLTNLYITYTEFGGEEKTAIHKISIGNGSIEYVAKGEVPGSVLNQFSMDEHEGYFRVATTRWDFWGGNLTNNVYVLDGGMRVVGRLENLAPGERIYSVRFMGDRGYMVTYVRVDPLFVLDLSSPSSPRVLGELKIPGYSDYLHPYDETHIIGIGKETTTGEWGGEISLGVKLALFDVSDPENPVEISKYVVGERGTESLALQDHRAFLFSRRKSLLAMPIGYWYQQEAYVFNISLENGITLKGTIGHKDWQVKRILYVEDALYTISDGMLKINSISDLGEIKSVELPAPYQQPIYRWIE
ncbi:MAG: beta-propeller domain-containing protein [Candidatus Hadarchaeales archaeon]